MTINVTQERLTRGVLIKTNALILTQLVHSLEIFNSENYPAIGGHVRHIIEFYQEFFKATLSAEKNLSYDQRERNLTLESSKPDASIALTDIINILVGLPLEDKNITLYSVIDPSQPMFETKTSYFRELFYLMDHTVHHMALIKLLGEKKGLSFPKEFGLAQSTKAYENKNT